MADKTDSGSPPQRPGKPYRAPPTIDLAPSDIVEETAPLATHAKSAETSTATGSGTGGTPGAAPAAAAAPMAASTSQGGQAKPAAGSETAGKVDAAKADAATSAGVKAASPATASAPSKAATTAPVATSSSATAATSALGGKTTPAGKPAASEPSKAAASSATGPAIGGGSSATASAKPSTAPSATPSTKPAAGSSTSSSAASNATSPASPGGGRAGSVVLAGVAGGLVGLAGAVGIMMYAPLQNSAGSSAAMDQAIDARVARAVPRGDIDTLKQQVAALASEIKAAREQGAALQAQIAANAASSPVASTTATDGNTSVVPLDAGAATAAASGAITALGSRLEALTQRLDTLEQTADAARQDAAASAALGPRLQQLEGTLKAIDPQAARTAADAATAKVNALASRLGSIEARPADPRVPLLARATIAMDINRAIEAGRPFPTELAALNAAGPLDPGIDIAALQRAAKSGVATTQQLVGAFSGVSDKVAAEKAKGESFIDRLAVSASRMVRIQPVDAQGVPVAGIGTTTAVEAALARGDLKSALDAWRALPEPARQISAAFGEQLSTRVAAQTAAMQMMAGAMAALAADASTPATAAEGSAR